MWKILLAVLAVVGLLVGAAVDLEAAKRTTVTVVCDQTVGFITGDVRYWKCRPA